MLKDSWLEIKSILINAYPSLTPSCDYYYHPDDLLFLTSPLFSFSCHFDLLEES